VTKSVRLSKRLVDALKPGEILFDTTVKGFLVRRQQRYAVYGLKVRIDGRQRWLSIGQHGAPWTVETAREEAQRLWGQIRAGVNIVAVRESKRNQPMIEELCERFLEEHSRQHNKPATVLGYERNNRNHIIPLLGGRTVAEITRTDIEEFKRKIRDGITSKRTKRRREGGTGGLDVRGGPGAANRTLGQLSKMFNLAEVWGWRPENSNPVRKVIRYKERKLERFLSTEELLRVGQVLVDFEATGAIMPSAMACIRLLIFTGARLGEILTLQWAHVDIERRLLLLPDSKTGQKPIVLNQQCIEVLQSIPRIANCPWVITGHLDGEHLKSLQPAWDKVRRAAGIPDVRIHDLRHSFASFAVMSGGTLPVIGKLLGHNTPITTARYAHLSNDPVSHLAEITGTALANAMSSGKVPGETDAEQQKAADTFETLKGKLAELLADMEKLSKPS
jgi:integrase